VKTNTGNNFIKIVAECKYLSVSCRYESLLLQNWGSIKLEELLLIFVS
jgi:hypothetical protein